MIGCEDVSCDEGKLFHLLVVGLMHGAFEADVDESLCEVGVLQAILNEYFHINFDLGVYSRDC